MVLLGILIPLGFYLVEQLSFDSPEANDLHGHTEKDNYRRRNIMLQKRARKMTLIGHVKLSFWKILHCWKYLMTSENRYIKDEDFDGLGCERKGKASKSASSLYYEKRVRRKMWTSGHMFWVSIATRIDIMYPKTSNSPWSHDLITNI